MAVSTQLILASAAFQGFQWRHLETSDRRGRGNIGEFELGNILLAIWHGLRFIQLLIGFRPKLAYLPISQGSAGYLRDLMFRLPCRWLKIPTVAHLRGSEFGSFYAAAGPALQALIRYSLAKIRRVIVLGEGLRAQFAGLVPAGRIVVVPNGTVEVGSPRASYARTDGGLQGLFLSNLRVRKGVLVALEAAIETVERFPQVEFVFAGEWQSAAVEAQVRARLKDCPLAGHIHFPGVVTGEAKDLLLLQSDFLIFPPIEPEGQPRVVLEAMAAGLPVITTDQGAIRETVVDGQTGFIVAAGSVGTISEKLAELIENECTRAAMGAAARARFLGHYTAQAANERLAGVLSTVLAEGRPALL